MGNYNDVIPLFFLAMFVVAIIVISVRGDDDE